MLKLPPLHLKPKIHKSPTGSRFIIGSKKSSLKPLGKAITKIFKVLFHHKRRYFRKAGFFSGLKYCWCIDSHQEVIETLDRISNKNKAKSVSTYDFSTLYTKIPHNDLIKVLHEIIDSTFNDTNRRYMSVGIKRAYWVKGVFGLRHKFNIEEVKESVTFLINNAYFRVGKTIFRQIIGIPMGSDPAPFFANLFLFNYESKWVKSNSYNNYARAKKLFYAFRFIDDLLALNDNNEFGNIFKQIYPPSLVLNKENINDQSATFLDLSISIQDSKFDYKLYDKRNAFPFDIVRFPFRSSNMPIKMFYSTIQAEILRICRATVQFDSFINECNPLLDRMVKQGAKKADLNQPLKKIISRHFGEFSKYQYNKEQLLSKILN